MSAGDFTGMNIVTSKYVPEDQAYIINGRQYLVGPPSGFDRDILTGEIVPIPQTITTTGTGPTNMPYQTSGGIIGGWGGFLDTIQQEKSKKDRERELQEQRDELQDMLNYFNQAAADLQNPDLVIKTKPVRAPKPKAEPAAPLSKHGRVILPEDE